MSYGKPGFELAAEALRIKDAIFHPTRELAAWRRRMMREYNARTEAKLRGLLEQWVSEIPPAIALGPDGEIMGLCDAGAPIGSKPFIFRGDNAGDPKP